MRREPNLALIPFVHGNAPAASIDPDPEDRGIIGNHVNEACHREASRGENNNGVSLVKMNPTLKRKWRSRRDLGL